jgi:3-mercaptopyruvate sulfurtransferase SseA
MKHGYPHVYALQGGFLKWQDQSLPVARGGTPQGLATPQPPDASQSVPH